MAKKTLTTNLKLRITDDLSSDSVYNLNKIDTLGLNGRVDNTGSLRFKAASDIQLQPNSSDVGGSGSGGTVLIGEAGTNISLLDIRAEETLLTGGPLSLSNSTAKISLLVNPSQTSDLSLVLPEEDGSSNQALVTDGSGNLSWGSFLPFTSLTASRVLVSNSSSEVVSSSISSTELSYLSGVTSNIQAQIDTLGGASQLSTTWVPADGLTKTVTHNFGSRNILVQILDNANDYANIEVETVTRPTDNTVVMVTTEVPQTEWTILVMEIGV